MGVSRVRYIASMRSVRPCPTATDGSICLGSGSMALDLAAVRFVGMPLFVFTDAGLTTVQELWGIPPVRCSASWNVIHSVSVAPHTMAGYRAYMLNVWVESPPRYPTSGSLTGTHSSFNLFPLLTYFAKKTMKSQQKRLRAPRSSIT